MNAKTHSRRPLGAFAALAALALASALHADDRDVLRDSATRPYMFVLLDTSGSMNWSPKCTAAQVADGICSYQCDSGDCATPRNGDDPASKFRQSKEALYEVLRTVDDVDFGFATFNQDNLIVPNKHFLYQVRAGEPQIALAGGFSWPTHGSQEVFGATFACDTDDAGVGDDLDDEIGCYSGDDNSNVENRAADVNDVWEITRVRRFSKLGSNGSTAGFIYVRSGGRVYYITYDDPASAQTLGNASIQARIQVAVCTGTPFANPDNSCDAAGERTVLGTIDVDYDLVGDFLMYDYQVDRTPELGAANGYFGNVSGGRDSDVANTCEGWELNTDSALGNDGEDDDNPNNTYNLKWPTTDDPVNPDRHATAFDYGDVIPLDWTQSNKGELLNRLASRLNGGDPTGDPGAFGNATYLRDSRLAGDAFLRYKNSTQRTLMPNGSTPLGWSLKGFREWYRGCENGSCPNATGWDDIAAANDPNWACRKKFLVVLTDGDDTCPGRDPCSFTASMRAQDDIFTYVIAFGVENTPGNRLNCMAHNGGTGEPIYPQNKQELVEALLNIIGQIREQAASFASAAVPQVQANATDKIFLSSFTPVTDPDNRGYWAGRLDAFLKPLPLDDKNQPDRSVVCSSTRQSQCFLWDAGDVQNGHLGDSGYAPGRLLLQAPHPTELALDFPWTASQLRIGTGADQRRVVYTSWAEPGNRRLLTYPTNAAQKFDLWTGFGMAFVATDLTAPDNGTNAVLDDGNFTVAKTLVEKEAIIEEPDPDDPDEIIERPITYLMGDIFHADPIVLGRPSNFTYYNNDPFLNRPLCGGSTVDDTRSPPTSYRWFADRHNCRRSMLITAANDGQLHVFDAGTFGQDGSTAAECLLPAKDLDNDGVAEVNEFNLSGFGDDDYDLDDAVENLVDHIIDGKYSNGTGREIFSFIPRAMMPTVYDMAHGSDRNVAFWGMDGSPRVDDVFIDPLATEGSVTCVNRAWRTVLIGGYREGGPGYYALDITQPDVLNNDHVPLPSGSPAYVPSCFDGTGTGCTRPFPSVLWEFQDEATITISGVPVVAKLDEDLNDVADLGNSWSRAATGRIRVCTGACDPQDAEDRFVAVLGGGIGDSPSTATGGYIYMIDIETGKTIYKEQVIGGVPGDVAAIDYNGDGYIDRLYAGTVSGFVYKVELESSLTNPHLLATQTIQTRIGGVNYNHTVDRIQGPTGDTDKYDPFQVFSTGGRPIYHEISTIFVAQKNRVAIAFGTGNRWNLWDNSGAEGRFYVLLDDNWSDPDRDGVLDVTCSGCTEPLTESKYTAIDPNTPFNASDPVVNYLFDGGASGTLPGWYFTLEENEKVITEGFSLAGITMFTSFVPTNVVNDDGTCSKAGTSRVFITGTVTAVAYSFHDSGTGAQRAQFSEIQGFTTPPFVERSSTANPESGNSTQHADYITETLGMIRDELKKLQSNRCRYAGYTQNVKTIRADTGVVFVAPIPLCIDPTSVKEF